MFARTRRLTLRPGWPEDAPALVDAVAHESVVTMLAHAPWPYRLEHAESFLAQPHDDRTPRFLILSHAASYPRIIGGIALTPDSHGHEFGYWLTPDAWGHGYATEAGRAVLAMARHALGLRNIHSGHFADNSGSGRVLRKLGFRETGAAMRSCRARGEDVPGVTFELDLTGAHAVPLAA